MRFWIFKVSDQRFYADVEGHRYEYDNRHSVRVRAGDRFVYLDKRGGGYRFTGAGTVASVNERLPTNVESTRGSTVRAVYAALLADLNWFDPPVDIYSRSIAGRRNREALGISGDVNAMGWSISMPTISAEQFENIVMAGLGGGGSEPPSSTGNACWAPPAGPLAAVTPSLEADSAESPDLMRRSNNPAHIGLTAERIVHEFLAGGELEKLGGSGLRWRSRDGEHPGWDMEYEDRAGDLKAVEVKGTTAVRFASVEVTKNEWRAAAELSSRYWLYLVADCWGNQPQIQRIENPFARAVLGEFSAIPIVWRLQQIKVAPCTPSEAAEQLLPSALAPQSP